MTRTLDHDQGARDASHPGSSVGQIIAVVVAVVVGIALLVDNSTGSIASSPVGRTWGVTHIALQQLADESFVSLTTFRRSGQGVATPVWVIADPGGDRIVVMTPADSGKVKRVRRDPRVTLRPCGRFGAVEDDAPSVQGTAHVGVFDERLEQAFKDAYGAEYRVVMGVERLRGGSDRVALHIR